MCAGICRVFVCIRVCQCACLCMRVRAHVCVGGCVQGYAPGVLTLHGMIAERCRATQACNLLVATI